jgi:hypothetical protein
LRTLRSFAEASAVVAWYHEGDLVALKNWYYVRAKLEFILMQPPYSETGGSAAYENRALHGLFSLISEHKDLIAWYSSLDAIFDNKRINNPKIFDFWTEQFFVALRGEWDILAKRCDLILANPPTSSREKKFLIDHRFYLALARGDALEMKATIEQLVTEEILKKRAALEGGFTSGLISTPALLYSKLAWRRGYQIEVDSPYIPKPWLTIEPLAQYTDPFDFMREYNVRV